MSMKFDFAKVIGNTAVQEVEPPVVTSEEINVNKIKLVKEHEEEEVSNNITPIKPNNVIDENDEAKRFSTIIAEIKKELNDKYLEREDEIDVLIAALVSGTNVFLHGVPGTGKSDLVEEISNRITGGEYFRILMSKTTEPSEVFGPVSINALKNDKYKVITDKKLPQANIAFLDEVFKSNSAILNGLLTIMNEKIFFNDTVEQAPIVSVIGASNEFPEEDGLAALYDRFLLRCNVKPIKDANNRTKLFTSFLNGRDQSSNVNSTNVVSNKKKMNLRFDELQLLIELAKKVNIDSDTLKVYNSLFNKLEKEGVTVSDRRKNESLKVIQATALINGRMDACTEDFELLTYCFWEEIDDIEIVKDIIRKLANPDKDFIDSYLEDLNKYKGEIKELMKEYEEGQEIPDEITKAVKITEIRTPVTFAMNKITEKMATVKNPANKTKIEELYKSFEQFQDEITKLLIG